MRIILFIQFCLIFTISLANDTLQDCATRALNERNYLALAYDYSHFNQSLSPWHTLQVEGQFQRKKWVLIPRLIATQRFDQQAGAVEFETYRKFENKDYVFGKLAFSPSDVLARTRVEVEYFNPFHKKWEFSLGTKYMNFQDSIDVTVLTASLSKYTGKFYSLLRFTTGWNNSNHLNVFSASFQQRYYHNDFEFSALSLGYGFDPNTLLFNASSNINVVQSTVINASLFHQRPLNSRWFLEGKIEYTYFDFGASQRNQFLYAIKLFYTW